LFCDLTLRAYLNLLQLGTEHEGPSLVEALAFPIIGLLTRSRSVRQGIYNNLARNFFTGGSHQQHPCHPTFHRVKMDDIADSFEGTVSIHQDKGKGRGGAGRRGGGGGRGHGRGGGGGASREMLLSKALSKLLRHQAVSAGIQLDREGYAALDKVVGSFCVIHLAISLV
jgi:hypothetical protein